MTSEDPLLWHRRMGEAAHLPPEDPLRGAVEADVAQRGGLVEREWLALLEEGERLRIEMRRVEPPQDLEMRLLAIAEPARGSGGRGGRRLAWTLGGAAALVLVGLLVQRLGAPGDLTAQLTALARLAADDHRGTHALEVTTDVGPTLERDLAPRIPFPIRVPELGTDARLVGGRRCTLGKRTVCFSAWSLGGVRATLIQLRPAEFGLPSELAPRRVAVEATVSAPATEVLVWVETGVGYALVADDARALRAPAR
jgi:hypothetical protein